MSELTGKAEGERVLATLVAGQEVLAAVEKRLEKDLLIGGKPMDHWKDYFNVPVQADNMSPTLCRQAEMKIFQLTHEATFFYNVAHAKQQMVTHGSDTVFTRKFNELVQEYKQRQGKLPAAATLETLAKADQLNVESAKTIANVELKFWDNVLKKLAKQQSLLKDTAMMISTELKHMDNLKMHEANERNSQ